MTTLADLQRRMNGENEQDALAAAVELANFYFIYNEEYNALQDKLVEANAAYVQATQGGNGVDQALGLRLQAFTLEVKARMATLDLKMRAFHNGSPIKPPNSTNVQTVKDLSRQMATLTAGDQALSSVIDSLAQIGNIVKSSTD